MLLVIITISHFESIIHFMVLGSSQKLTNLINFSTILSLLMISRAFVVGHSLNIHWIMWNLTNFSYSSHKRRNLEASYQSTNNNKIFYLRKENSIESKYKEDHPEQHRVCISEYVTKLKTDGEKGKCYCGLYERCDEPGCPVDCSLKTHQLHHLQKYICTKIYFQNIHKSCVNHIPAI